MKIIDDGSKKLHWWNKNYFFAVTISVIILNYVLYAVFPGTDWVTQFANTNAPHWNDVLSFGNLFSHFLSAFCHLSFQHLFLNMLCFLICGCWLERRKGSLFMLLLVLAMAVTTEAFIGANDLSVRSFGYSGVNYGLYAYAIIDYIFLLLRKQSRTLDNVISGAILIALIYFAACFSGGTSRVTFEWYPYDFLHNMGHYSAFLAGAIMGLAVQIAKFTAVRER